MNSLPIRRIVIILSAIFLVSAGIAAALFFTQLWPFSYDRALVNEEKYVDAWEFPFVTGNSLDIDLSGVDVDIIASNVQSVQARFEGYRYNANHSERAYIDAKSNNGTIKLSEVTNGRPRVSITIGTSVTPRIRGKLTVELPKGQFGNITVESFSGAISMDGCEANSISVDSSSGDLFVRQLNASGPLAAKSFSGDHTMENISAGAITLESSSGNMQINVIRAQSLNHESFSGDVAIENAVIKGKLSANTSSGGIKITDAAADRIDTTSFSGDQILAKIQTSALNTDSSSGKLTAELMNTPEIDTKTFSGDVEITLPKDAAFSIDVSTFSGETRLGYPALFLDSDKKQKEFSATVGSPERHIKIDTSSGNITIMPAQ